MRTTVNLDDGLLAIVKRLARERGESLGAVLEAAIQQYLAAYTPNREVPLQLPVFQGHLGVRPGVDLRTNSGLSDAIHADEDAEMAARILNERS